jgi:hypothetical protein
VQAFRRDVDQVFANAVKFNRENSSVGKVTVKLMKKWQRKYVRARRA